LIGPPPTPASAQAILQVLSQRAATIALANLPLGLIIGGTAATSLGPRFDQHIPTIIILLLVVGILGLLAYSDRLLDSVVDALHMRDEAGKSVPVRSPLRVKSVFLAYVVTMIVLDFVALGQSIQASGGFVTSPFTQLAATLLIMGAVMASELRSQVVIFLFGVGYFAVLAYTTWLGAVIPLELDKAARPETVYLAVAAANLLIGLVITKRTRRSQTLTSTGGVVSPAGSNPPEPKAAT
jgi:hypothetical protein